MRMRKPILAALLLFALPACPAATDGNGLCAAATVTTLCGIPNEECLALLDVDATFDREHIYTNWRVSLDDEDNCILDVRDADTDEDVTFDLGVAQPPGTLLNGDA
jgi:hypothetical protein